MKMTQDVLCRNIWIRMDYNGGIECWVDGWWRVIVSLCLILHGWWFWIWNSQWLIRHLGIMQQPVNQQSWWLRDPRCRCLQFPQHKDIEILCLQIVIWFVICCPSLFPEQTSSSCEMWFCGISDFPSFIEQPFQQSTSTWMLGHWLLCSRYYWCSQDLSRAQSSVMTTPRPPRLSSQIQERQRFRRTQDPGDSDSVNQAGGIIFAIQNTEFSWH